MGVTVESGRYAARADALRRVPAAIRHISAEPLLGPLDALDLTGIDLVIAGGESGPGRRPPQPDWLRGLRDRCLAAGVAFAFKGWGGASQATGGRLLDGREWRQSPPLPADPAGPIQEALFGYGAAGTVRTHPPTRRCSSRAAPAASCPPAGGSDRAPWRRRGAP